MRATRPSDDEKALRDLLGDPKEAERRTLEFRKSMDALNEQWPQLVERYPQQWVALHKGEVAAHSRDLESLFAKLEKKGVPQGHALLRFVRKKPIRLMV